MHSHVDFWACHALQVAVNPSPTDPMVESVRHSLQAAFSAVDNEDIMHTSFDNLSYQGPGNMSIGRTDNFTNVDSSSPSHRQNAVSGSGPPTLSMGADDIFWMSKLHNALVEVQEISPSEYFSMLCLNKVSTCSNCNVPLKRKRDSLCNCHISLHALSGVRA